MTIIRLLCEFEIEAKCSPNATRCQARVIVGKSLFMNNLNSNFYQRNISSGLEIDFKLRKSE